MKENAIVLNELPKDKEFEEYVSSIFQSGGFYIEKNIIDRQEEEVLELDIIVTNYCTQVPTYSIVEVKSGGWGFPDIFKLKGWQDYTNIPHSLFIVQLPKSKQDFYAKILKKLNIKLILIEDFKNPGISFNGILKANLLDETDLNIWRYSFWVERNLLKLLNQKKNSIKDKKCYYAISQYYHNINNGVFLTENFLDRIDKLFDNFKNCGLISTKTCNEMVGNPYESNSNSLDYEVFCNTYYKCELNDIQITTFVEHFSRLTILKNTIDYLMYKNTGDSNRTDETLKFWENVEFSRLDFLPFNFVGNMSELGSHKYFNRYAVFWQWFLWYFGGFILLDYKTEDYV